MQTILKELAVIPPRGNTCEDRGKPHSSFPQGRTTMACIESNDSENVPGTTASREDSR